MQAAGRHSLRKYAPAPGALSSGHSRSIRALYAASMEAEICVIFCKTRFEFVFYFGQVKI
jgi:hypothetical protein